MKTIQAPRTGASHTRTEFRTAQAASNAEPQTPAVRCGVRTTLLCAVAALLFAAPAVLKAQSTTESHLSIALLKYRGGGDWYANPTSLSGLIHFCNANASFRLQPDYATVEVGSADLFNYPFVHMTGHGNVSFSPAEAENLRRYLTGGGFLHIDDNYGIDASVRREMKKVFPNQDFVPVPLTHPIFNQVFDYSHSGLPKVHEHDNKQPQAFALMYQGRIVCFYTYECDLGDGWEDSSVHGDSYVVRRKALEMGCNILTYAFSY